MVRTNYGCITKNNVKYTLSLTTEDRYIKYNNVHLVLNKTKYRLYNQKPNKLSVVQAETKQKISCTSRNKTKDQLYKHKQNKISVVQAETKQKINCTSINKTKDQLYKQKQNKRSVLQAETKQKISCTSSVVGI